MNQPLSNIVDIKPQPRSQSNVLVQVVENNNIQQTGSDFERLMLTDGQVVENNNVQQRTGSDLKRLMLTDGQGTQLLALIYSNHLRYFANLLSPYKRYLQYNIHQEGCKISNSLASLLMDIKQQNSR